MSNQEYPERATCSLSWVPKLYVCVDADVGVNVWDLEL